MSKLTKQDVIQLRYVHNTIESDATQVFLADIYDVAPRTVGDAVNGITWSELPLRPSVEDVNI